MYRRQPLLFQPVPQETTFSFNDLLEEVRASLFPEVPERVEARVSSEAASLACIESDFMGVDRHLVLFHPILNRADTPVEVARFIAKHELIHIVRPPRWTELGYEVHPPEFWDLEYELAPERWAAWHWIHKNLRRYARDTRWGFRVFRNWRRLDGVPRSPYTPGLPLHHERWDRAFPDDAQLRLPPDWAPAPLPLGGGY